MINNPILRADFPDPDVIRVNDTYYMISTTMHFMPGAVILRSFDLINWEICTYVYDSLDDTPAQKMEGDESIYGQGMWAASLRYHHKQFYVCFVAYDTQKTYLYQAQDIEGPWEKQTIEGFYHDPSLLFDDDDRIYIVYGNTEIYLTELNEEMTGPKPGGLQRLILRDKEGIRLGYEGSHIYKVNNRYYLFLIHWLSDGSGRRVEACFSSDSLEGEFTGKDILDDDMGYFNMGVAQGGIVDTPDGNWFAVLFQDQGAIGRVPVLVPMHWENDFPVFGIDGKVPSSVETKSTHPYHTYEPIVSSDEFQYSPDADGRIQLNKVWQWNHIPNNDLWSVDGEKGSLHICSGKLSENVTRAVNLLTQRTVWPACDASVHVDGSMLNDGDYAGICALQGCYGMIAITKEGADPLTVPMIVDADRAGDPVARSALEKIGGDLGIGIASLVNTLNPELVVCGGILSLAGEFLMPAAIREFEQRALRWNREATKVVLAQHGFDAAAMGGVAAVYETILSQPNLIGSLQL